MTIVRPHVCGADGRRRNCEKCDRLIAKDRQKQRLPPDMRDWLMRRDNYECVICGLGGIDYTQFLQIDHIIPRSKGGRTDPDNLQTLCVICNASKGDRV